MGIYLPKKCREIALGITNFKQISKLSFCCRILSFNFSMQEAKRQALAAKKAEVRKRLEEAGKKGKKKKGFLTPERKKKLRVRLFVCE